MTLLVRIFCPSVDELVLCLDVVNSDRAVLNQLLAEEASQRNVLCARGIGAMACHTKSQLCCLYIEGKP